MLRKDPIDPQQKHKIHNISAMLIKVQSLRILLDVFMNYIDLRFETIIIIFIDLILDFQMFIIWLFVNLMYKLHFTLKTEFNAL